MLPQPLLNCYSYSMTSPSKGQGNGVESSQRPAADCEHILQRGEYLYEVRPHTFWNALYLGHRWVSVCVLWGSSQSWWYDDIVWSLRELRSLVKVKVRLHKNLAVVPQALGTAVSSLCQDSMFPHQTSAEGQSTWAQLWCMEGLLGT